MFGLGLSLQRGSCADQSWPCPISSDGGIGHDGEGEHLSSDAVEYADGWEWILEGIEEA